MRKELKVKPVKTPSPEVAKAYLVLLRAQFDEQKRDVVGAFEKIDTLIRDFEKNPNAEALKSAFEEARKLSKASSLIRDACELTSKGFGVSMYDDDDEDIEEG